MFVRAKKLNSRGFTILELTIASSVFAVILLVIAAGVIAFTRQYYKGIVTTKTQAAARAIMSEVNQSLEFSRTANFDLAAGSTEGFCVDNKLFSYIIGRQIKDGTSVNADKGPHGFVVDSSAPLCSDTTAPTIAAAFSAGDGQRELLGDNMRLSVLSIEQGDNNLYTVHVRVIYGDAEVLVDDTGTALTAASAAGLSEDDWASVKCSPDKANSEFCAISDLTTTVQKRL
jgi:prepilin-type N-terminal cleavage/methylation domain-containing protein